MGILDRNRAHGGRQQTGTTLLAAGSKLVGDLALSDNLHVDGRIEGKIRSSAEVAIGEQGQVEGELEAERVLVSGSFEGSISAERLEIFTSGRVSGDITVRELVIEPGGRFNGNSRIRDAEAPRRLAHESGATDKTAESGSKTDKGTQKAAAGQA